MKNKFYIICIFICTHLLCYAQLDINQKMVNKLMNGNYDEAIRFHSYTKLRSSTLHPSIEKFYNYSMANFKNKPDSATIYLEDILTGDGMYDDPFIFELYFQLWKLYAETLQNYDKALLTCNRIKSFIEEKHKNVSEQTFRDWSGFVLDWQRQTHRRMIEPVIKISRDDSKNSIPILNDTIHNLFFFEAQYNKENKQKTFFDTGVTEYFLINSDIAKKIGVRKFSIYDNDSTGVLNGKKVDGYLGILDSVRIANIILYNIPVTIANDSSLVNSHIVESLSIDSIKKEELRYFYKNTGIMMGLKTMSLIERIVLDIKNNELCFPVIQDTASVNSVPNMFRFANRLFTHIKVNGVKLAAFIDTGYSDYINLDSWFYERNKENIPLNKIIEKEPYNAAMLHTVRQDIPYEIVDNPLVSFEGKMICALEDDKVVIQSLLDWNEPNTDPMYIEITEGVLGSVFIKNLGHKILFDFQNMRIETVE